MSQASASPLTIDSRVEGDACTLRLAGRLDALGQLEAERALGELVASGGRRFILDCASLEFISSAGMRAIIGLVRSLKPLGGSIAVCGAPAPVRQALEFSGLRALLSICDSVDDGRRQLGLDPGVR